MEKLRMDKTQAGDPNAWFYNTLGVFDAAVKQELTQKAKNVLYDAKHHYKWSKVKPRGNFK